MKSLQRLLLMILVAELCWYGMQSLRVVRGFAPPRPPVEQFDVYTAGDLEFRYQLALSDPGFATGYDLGRVLLGVGQYRQAAQCFDYCRRVEPEQGMPAYFEGLCLERMGRIDDALPLLESALQTEQSTLINAYNYQMGRCLLRQEKPEQADEFFAKGMDTNTMNYQRALLLLESGQPLQAGLLLDRELAKAGDIKPLLRLRARVADELQRPNEARGFRWRERLSNNQLPLRYSNYLLAQFSTSTGASQLFQRCIDVSKDSESNAVTCMLKVLDGLEEDQHIIIDYRLRHLVEKLIEAMGDPEIVADLLNRHDRGGNFTAQTFEFRAMLLGSQGHMEEAFEFWKRARLLAPTGRSFQANAVYLQSKGELEQAAALLVPGNIVVAWERIGAGELEEAYEVLKRAADFDNKDAVAPHAYRARLNYLRGLVNMFRGKLDLARTALREAVKETPHDGRAAVLLADVELLQQGRSAMEPPLKETEAATK